MALMDLIIFLLVALLSSMSLYGVEGGRSISKEDLELETQLKSLNKPPIKTFQTEERDIIDCIDIHKQPAFDHPLLKNHKIQMRPTSLPNGLIGRVASPIAKHSRSTQNIIDCPEGTVAIRRTQKEDLIRAKSFSNSVATNIHPLSTSFPGQHIAILRSVNDTYMGIKGSLDVYNPTVAKNQGSTGQLWVENGPIDELCSIQAGWMVAPALYGDNKTRGFAYWTGDGFHKTGCFNFLCVGFVQVSKNHIVGGIIINNSKYGGTQYEYSTTIFQDVVTGHWWLMTEDAVDEHVLGYWPKPLLPHLARGASVVAWGGLARGPPNGVSPPMGSGHFPDGNYKHSCYLSEIKVINTSNYLINPQEHHLEIVVENHNCYDVKYYGYRGKDWGYVLMFGGPGGVCGI